MAIPEGSIGGAATLVVAVILLLAVGRGAEAQFNIRNQSSRMIAISTGAGNVIIGSKATLHLSCPTSSFLMGDVNITLQEEDRDLILVPVPSQDVAFLSSLFGLNTVTIARSRSCVTLTVTFTVLTQFSLSLGTICPPRPNLKKNKLSGIILQLQSVYSGAERTARKWLPTLPLPESGSWYSGSIDVHLPHRFDMDFF